MEARKRIRFSCLSIIEGEKFDLKLFLKNLKEQISQGAFSVNDKLIFYVVDTTGKEYTLKIKKTIKQLIEDNEKNM